MTHSELREQFVSIRDVRRGLIVLLLSMACVFFASHTSAEQIIINQRVDSAPLTRSSARAIFSMRLTHWPNGTLIRVFVLDDRHPLHRSFTKKVLGVFPYQLRKVWDRRIYSGIGQAPVRVASIEEMLQRVASTPGAIGYINDGGVTTDVSLLSVD